MIQEPAATIRVNKFQQSELVSGRLNPLGLIQDKQAISIIRT
ncbi:hypothetical protein [Trichormus variabilis]|nr:hypothetical protein [Trichormus variabilis]